VLPQTPWLTEAALAAQPWARAAWTWLHEPGSITQRLRRCFVDVTVRVLDEGVREPLADEWQGLPERAMAPCWVREVCLHSRGMPLVHARTVIPDWHAGNPWHEVGALGSRPLGERLFAGGDGVRGERRFAWTSPAPASPMAQQGGERRRPTRRTWYERQGAWLMLTEAVEAPLWTDAVAPVAASHARA
jgi:chorismate--pyruvate lyase